MGTSDHDSVHADPAPGAAVRVIRRAFPAVGPEWVAVAAHISTVLLELIEQERDGDVLPPPLGRGVALRAWGRVKTQLSSALARNVEPICTLLVSLDDLAVLGAAAQELGRSQLPHGNTAVAAALARAARPLERTPQQLVVQLARVHGVLDLDPHPSDLVAATSLDAAPEADLSARIVTMWRAGADHGLGRLSTRRPHG